MEDKKLKLRFILLLFLGLFSVFSTADEVLKNEDQSNNEANINNTPKEPYKREINPVILIDSVVIRYNNNNNLFDNVTGVKKIGEFLFEKEDKNLKNIFLKNGYQSQSLDLSFDAGYRLVEIPGKNNFISDGSFVVTFKDPRDKEQLSFDYKLTPRYIMPNAISYKSNNFRELQDLINTLKSDPRVKSVELDLIDPYVGPQ